ncbi:VLRF1 family aeRF1-type release factor [Thermus sp.]|jgi:peptide subunit release factor 1 (eRF1)|uniref:VLRF1 family aeRF1-type release factor n=1 Tax=Thermus sp. TaxID=275 RepID=UPI0028CEB81F|nr:VLRF1 family aeRF1-type release factor [Thermus sp.]MDT7909901.1 VLRF1 family aeRF1-type release factor [Thermus sp.]
MIGKEEVRRIKESLKDLKTPALSLYLDINPAKPDNAGRAYALRAKDAMKALAVPEALAEKVLELLQHEVIQAKTLALFADQERLELFPLQVELPLVRAVKTAFVDEKTSRLLTDGALAHYGEPFLLPLVYALDEYERYGVVYVDQERWRVFEVFLGEIAEVKDAFLALDTEAWRRLSLDAPGRRFNLGGIARGGAGQDLFAKRLAAWEERFYKALAHELVRHVEERGFTRLLLMGPEEHTKLFLGYLPKRLKEKVVAELPSLPHPGASPGEVLKRLEPVLEEVERQAEVRLLEELEEAYPKAAFGPEVLARVQEGRVELWVLPWHLERELYACDGLYLAEEAQALAYCQNPEKKPLAVVLPELAAGYAARVEFVRGEAERRLLERGGMAALLRW